ncbi:SurA N-terminal domain-containing protein [Rickettsiella massiliensis]|uniref:SurA N-terminal domain-containing protein n=1 Tax=Rickettsiella massiliensis TaxID=676517 RepID=UPI000299E6F1|nr:SurA N-terminal domain-containing protein [Rickettsiella massiliensis]
MLQSIRDKTQGWLTGTIIGLLVLVFVLWGIRGYLQIQGQGNQKIIARSAGQTLSQQEFDAAFKQVYQQAQQRLATSAPLNSELSEWLKQQLIARWSLDQMLVAAANKQNYRLIAANLNNVLLSIPAFQVNGHFSSTQFHTVLRHAGYKSFLDNLKKSLLIGHVQQGMVQSAFILPEELTQLVRWENQTRRFALLTVPHRLFLKTEPAISETQAKNYYEQHQNAWKVPEQVSIDYLKLSSAGMSDEKAFLDQRDQLADLSYRYPNSLASAAKQLKSPIHSSSLFSRQGGKDALTQNPNVLAMAFSPDVLQGNNSTLLDLDDKTTLVLRIKEHKAAAVAPFSEVKKEIITKLTQQAAIDKAQETGERLLERFQQKKTAKTSEINKLKLTWREFKPIKRDAPQLSERLRQTLFAMIYPKQSSLFPVFTGQLLANGDYVIIKLLAVEPGHSQSQTAEQQKQLRSRLAEQVGQLDYRLYIQSLLPQSKN